jgi:hypothetical protein
MKRFLSLTSGIFLVTLLCQTLAQPADLNGDGVADDGAAIQAMIDAKVGTVRLGKGTYRLTKTLVIDLAKTGFTSIEGGGTARLVMEGAGPAIHFIGHHEGSADPGSFKPETWDTERMPVVDGIEIVGKNAEADGIKATGTMQITVNRTLIRKCRHGIHLHERNRNVIISDCHIYENSGIGVYYDQVNLHQSNIVGSHISYCRGGGVVSRGGNVRNLHIGTCDIEANMGADFPPTANVLLDSAGGSIGEVAITGCTIQHTNKAPGCANIRILGAGDDPSLQRRQGRATTREGNVTITGNIFSDVQVNVHIKDSRGVTVTGNTFWEGMERDLVIEDSSHIVIGHNNFDRNPRYLVNGLNNAESNGILMARCEDCVFSGNTVSGVTRHAAAVLLTECVRCIVEGSSILDSDGIGLHLEKCRHCLVSDNIIRDDRKGEVGAERPVSLMLTGNDGNVIGTNMLSHGKKVQ